MLSEQEAQAYRLSIDRVEGLAASKLRAIDGASRAISFVTNLHAGIDRVATKAAASGVAFDCRPGCAHCCRARVEATEPEVFLMVRWVRRRPESDIAGLIDRLRRRAMVDDRMPGPVCAFLVDDRCSAYEVRPATCRTAHSLSVSACAGFSPEIPQDLKLIAEAEALMIGTSRAYRSVRLAASPRELNAAVLAVLEDGRSEEHWYAEHRRGS